MKKTFVCILAAMLILALTVPAAVADSVAPLPLGMYLEASASGIAKAIQNNFGSMVKLVNGNLILVVDYFGPYNITLATGVKNTNVKGSVFVDGAMIHFNFKGNGNKTSFTVEWLGSGWQ